MIRHTTREREVIGWALAQPSIFNTRLQDDHAYQNISYHL